MSRHRSPASAMRPAIVRRVNARGTAKPRSSSSQVHGADTGAPGSARATLLAFNGILWRGWNEETLALIQQKGLPVLLFVADPNALAWPFLKAVFRAMPANARLRAARW